MKVRQNFLQETYNCILEEDAALALEIGKILQGPAIDRPPLADNGYVDYYEVRLSDDQISEIASILLSFEAGAVADTGETTPATSHYGSMVDFWNGLIPDDDDLKSSMTSVPGHLLKSR
ncbi:MAG: hypothetical protein AAFZ01_03405 [Pseudomonadota bacterium]